MGPCDGRAEFAAVPATAGGNMKIGENRLRDHIRLLAPLFGFIAGIWALRLILAIADSPVWIIRITSVTTATSVAVLLAVFLLHIRRFGGYTNVVVAALLLNLWAQFLIIASIIFAAATRTENIYTAPEYSIPGAIDAHLRHIYGHLTFGIATGTLVGAAFGCLLLAILRALVPSRPTASWGAKIR
jgi:hypothetical protein